MARRSEPAGGVTSLRRYVTRSGCPLAAEGASQLAFQSDARSAVVNEDGADMGPHVPAASWHWTVHR